MSMAQDNMPGMYLTLLRVMTVSGYFMPQLRLKSMLESL